MRRDLPPEWAQMPIGLIIGFAVGLVLGLTVSVLAWVVTDG